MGLVTRHFEKLVAGERASDDRHFNLALWFFAIIGPATAIYALSWRRKLVESQRENDKRKMDVLDSMAEIYDNVNLIDFVESTEMSLRDANQQKHGIDMSAQTHTLMNQRLKNQIVPDHLDAFLEFTNITTVRERLRNKKIISADFIDGNAGWIRAQYITVQQGQGGLPDLVIYTTRNVDEEKRREEHLIRISMTDEMTGLRNRRCYVEDLAQLRERPLESDLVVFSIDVNGLKMVNDTKGHAAGDELINAAANIIALSVGQAGNVYRTGGDEFMALVNMKDPERVRAEIERRAGEWHGTLVDSIALSAGYASSADHPDATVDDLAHIADADMYVEKDQYYQDAGIVRHIY